MSWNIKFGGAVLDSDDFTIEELSEVEKASGVPWSLANPLRDIGVAKAFIAVALLRSGTPEKDVANALGKVTLKQMKTAFEWVPDVDEEEQEGEEEPDPSVQPPPPTSRASSRGARAKAGSRAT